MELKDAIIRLKDAARRGTGASPGTASVLLFAWNPVHPMRSLMSLDAKNRAAAVTVIEAAFSDQLDGGMVIEEAVGFDAINELRVLFGVDGIAWQD